jgi:hypothetical protein
MNLHTQIQKMLSEQEIWIMTTHFMTDNKGLFIEICLN